MSGCGIGGDSECFSDYVSQIENKGGTELGVVCYGAGEDDGGILFFCESYGEEVKIIE